MFTIKHMSLEMHYNLQVQYDKSYSYITKDLSNGLY